MSRVKRDPSIEDQLRCVISQALRECKNELAKQLIDVLSIQQKSNADIIIKELAERKG